MLKRLAAIALLTPVLMASGRDIANDPAPRPAVPLATPQGRFAHSLEIPNPVPANSGYRPGMTSKQYFEHLCRSEAGEFIFRTVKDVEGLMMLRPREALTDAMLMDRYALEDPYGAVLSSLSKPEDYYVQPTIGRYKYLEVPTNLSSDLGVGDSFIRYFRSTAPTSPKPVPGVLNGKTAMLPYVVAKSEVEGRKSSYGFIWRGVRREKDRDLGIAGGELIVIALESRDVLAVRRGYIRSGHARNTPTGVWWLGGQLCGNTKNLREHRFVTKVLVPAK